MIFDFSSIFPINEKTLESEEKFVENVNYIIYVIFPHINRMVCAVGEQNKNFSINLQ